MPRFVVLRHDHPSLHWDLMLESGDVLRTWRLTEPLAAGRAVAAVATFDHRPVYLDYEGPVSGGRGVVSRWEAGGFEWVEDGAGRVAIRLAGTRLIGTLELHREQGTNWKATFTDDRSGPP